VSRAQVVCDTLLELGDGERAGAARVLAELLVLEPGLLAEALALACEGPHRERVLSGTRLASAWAEGLQRHTWIRWDLLRSLRPVGWVVRARLEGGAEVYEAMVEAGLARAVGQYDTLAEAQAAVDGRLREGEEGWSLREVDPRGRDP
jgi:hypothetical protein